MPRGGLPIDLTTDPEIISTLKNTDNHEAVERMKARLTEAQPRKGKPHMAFAGGSPGQHRFCRMASKELGMKFSGKLTEDVAHLVICSSEKGLDYAPVDAEEFFFETLLMGKWIVGMDWLKDLFASKEFLPEEKYELLGVKGKPFKGPKLARLNRMKMFPRLLNGCSVYLYGNTFKDPYPDKQRLVRILKAGGASILAWLLYVEIFFLMECNFFRDILI